MTDLRIDVQNLLGLIEANEERPMTANLSIREPLTERQTQYEHNHQDRREQLWNDVFLIDFERPVSTKDEHEHATQCANDALAEFDKAFPTVVPTISCPEIVTGEEWYGCLGTLSGHRKCGYHGCDKEPTHKGVVGDLNVYSCRHHTGHPLIEGVEELVLISKSKLGLDSLESEH